MTFQAPPPHKPDKYTHNLNNFTGASGLLIALVSFLLQNKIYSQLLKFLIYPEVLFLSKFQYVLDFSNAIESVDCVYILKAIPVGVKSV